MSPELAAAVEGVYAGVADKSIVNAQQMKAIFGDNTQLMSQAVSMFIASSKDVPETIKAALAQHDFERLHRAVHQCKGSAGYIGAERVHAISLELQNSARSLQHQQQAASGEAGTAALQAPLEVRAQVHALSRCMAELFSELEGVQPQ